MRIVLESLFRFHVLRVKLVYDKDPSRDKSPLREATVNGKEIFMIMDFDQSTQSKYTESWLSAMEMEFMTAVEISLLPFVCFMMQLLPKRKLFTRVFFRFIDSNPQLHGTVIASINSLRDFMVSQHLKT